VSDSDAELIEASLLRLAELGIELRHGLYARFFAAFPERQADFLCPEATSVRMTDETLQILYGLAQDEDWAWPLIAELVATHRSYGVLPLVEYDAFIDLTLAELASALGPDWTLPCAAAWGRQAARFKALIAEATAEWSRILPQASTA
jgi:hemoglobin-like flavoprotein